MKVVIIGSFRKYYDEICETCRLFHEAGLEVLSPRISTITNPHDEFVMLRSDPGGATIKEIEDAVLQKILNSDYVYLRNPTGYVGISSSFEMGYACSINKPIYASDYPEDLRLRKRIDGIYSPQEFVDFVKKKMIEYIKEG